MDGFRYFSTSYFLSIKKPLSQETLWKIFAQTFVEKHTVCTCYWSSTKNLVVKNLYTSPWPFTGQCFFPDQSITKFWVLSHNERGESGLDRLGHMQVLSYYVYAKDFAKVPAAFRNPMINSSLMACSCNIPVCWWSLLRMLSILCLFY